MKNSLTSKLDRVYLLGLCQRLDAGEDVVIAASDVRAHEIMQAQELKLEKIGGGWRLLTVHFVPTDPDPDAYNRADRRTAASVTQYRNLHGGGDMVSWKHWRDVLRDPQNYPQFAAFDGYGKPVSLVPTTIDGVEQVNVPWKSVDLDPRVVLQTLAAAQAGSESINRYGGAYTMYVRASPGEPVEEVYPDDVRAIMEAARLDRRHVVADVASLAGTLSPDDHSWITKDRDATPFLYFKSANGATLVPLYPADSASLPTVGERTQTPVGLADRALLIELTVTMVAAVQRIHQPTLTLHFDGFSVREVDGAAANRIAEEHRDQVIGTWSTQAENQRKVRERFDLRWNAGLLEAVTAQNSPYLPETQPSGETSSASVKI